MLGSFFFSGIINNIEEVESGSNLDESRSVERCFYLAYFNEFLFLFSSSLDKNEGSAAEKKLSSFLLIFKSATF